MSRQSIWRLSLVKRLFGIRFKLDLFQVKSTAVVIGDGAVSVELIEKAKIGPDDPQQWEEEGSSKNLRRIIRL